MKEMSSFDNYCCYLLMSVVKIQEELKFFCLIEELTQLNVYIIYHKIGQPYEGLTNFAFLFN